MTAGARCVTCGHTRCPGRFGNPAACWAARGLEPVEVTTFSDREPRYAVRPEPWPEGAEKP